MRLKTKENVIFCRGLSFSVSMIIGNFYSFNSGDIGSRQRGPGGGP
jgi:hypothetical protein